MKVLLDHCMPRRFGRLLVGHVVHTSASMGWERLRNGVLLSTASLEYDVLVTVDKNLQFQQNASTLPMPVISLNAATNQPHVLTPFAAEVLRLLDTPLQNRVYVIDV